MNHSCGSWSTTTKSITCYVCSWWWSTYIIIICLYYHYLFIIIKLLSYLTTSNVNSTLSTQYSSASCGVWFGVIARRLRKDSSLAARMLVSVSCFEKINFAFLKTYICVCVDRCGARTHVVGFDTAYTCVGAITRTLSIVVGRSQCKQLCCPMCCGVCWLVLCGRRVKTKKRLSYRTRDDVYRCRLVERRPLFDAALLNQQYGGVVKRSDVTHRRLCVCECVCVCV